MTVAILVSACTLSHEPAAVSYGPLALVTVADAALPKPLTFIAYGDVRFTDPSETQASVPAVRQLLVAEIAAQHPAAVFVSGDLPWHGGTVNDYAVYLAETARWREQRLRIYPALGNHEFAGCAEADCLDNWWSVFPELRGHRWYSVQLGSRVRALAVDSDTSLLEGAPQRDWLESELQNLPASVQFVLIWLHHPPLADLATGALSDHDPRPNETLLADYLGRIQASLRARILVVAGHIHNYERFERDGITYLVSGGGGAHPYPVERSAQDLYRGTEFPNFHYVRFRLERDRLSAEMVRVADPDAAVPHVFEVRDRFEIRAR